MYFLSVRGELVNALMRDLLQRYVLQALDKPRSC